MKASDSLPETLNNFLVTLCNEPSLGMCYVQQHMKESGPQIEQTKHELKKSLEKLRHSLPDIDHTISEVQNIGKLLEDWTPIMFFMMDGANNHLESHLQKRLY